MNLTIPNNIAKIPITDTNQYGFGISFFQGAIAMCRMVYGFFYTQNFIMVGVAGGRKTCRLLEAVFQPVAPTARGLESSDGGLINHLQGGLL